jgi:hypothetical protein
VTIGQPSGDQNSAYQWSYTNHCSDKISDTQAHQFVWSILSERVKEP